MKLSELDKGEAIPLGAGVSSFSLGSGPTIPSMKLSDLSGASAGLQSSQNMVDQSRVFQTPLTQIAGGHGDELGDTAKGGFKQAVKDFFSGGAQNAGPVGAGMLANAPGFAQDLHMTDQALQPANTNEAVGMGQTGLAEMLLGGGKALKTIGDATGLSAMLASRKEGKAVGKIAEALNPELTGKKLSKAYQGVGTGDRSALPKKLFSEQTLTPDEDTVDLASRLKNRGSMSGKNALEDLNSISGDFTKTEKGIDDLFQGDPSLVYNADKQTLFQGLADLHAKIPEEFKAIKENQSVYDAVVNYGKKVAQEAEDTPKGIREARKKFDYQAKTEFPTAYDESGVINLKSPAGRGIKAVRDLLNNHTYETAPQGSKIKEEILHESDLYKAIQRLAPKAATAHGMNKIRELIKEHPILSTIFGSALGTGIVAEAKQQL